MKIVTSVVNNPTYIEIQHYTLKKFFKGDYEFIVFNDAKDFPDFSNFNDPTIKKQIEETCSRLGVKCINIPNEHHKLMTDACIRCANSMNYILNYQLSNPDKYLIIDSDMFLIDYLDPERYLSYDCAIVLQSRNNNMVRNPPEASNIINYFWNGLVYMDIPKMKNLGLLNWSSCRDCDVGGMMANWLNEWIRENPRHQLPTVESIRYDNGEMYNDNIYFIKHLWSGTWNDTEIPHNLKGNIALKTLLQNDIRNTNGKYFCEIYDNCFLHIRAGGNWMNDGKKRHEIYASHLTKSLLNN